MKRNVMLLSVIVLLLGCVASAAVNEGDTEVSLLGGWIDIESGAAGTPDSDGLLLSGSLAQFVTPNVQVGGVALGAWLDNAGTDTDVYGIGGLLKYHFNPGNSYVPYVGATLMWGTADVGNAPSADGMIWGPNVGVRFELNPNNDLAVQYDYLMMDGDIDQTVDNIMALWFSIIHTFK
jgi:hypothetical protein